MRARGRAPGSSALRSARMDLYVVVVVIGASPSSRGCRQRVVAPAAPPARPDGAVASELSVACAAGLSACAAASRSPAPPPAPFVAREARAVGPVAQNLLHERSVRRRYPFAKLGVLLRLRVLDRLRRRHRRCRPGRLTALEHADEPVAHHRPPLVITTIAPARAGAPRPPPCTPSPAPPGCRSSSTPAPSRCAARARSRPTSRSALAPSTRRSDTGPGCPSAAAP